MITAAAFRELALALPETEEKAHFDQPDFRVRNKIFAGLSVDQKRGVLKMSPDAQTMVLDAAPQVFSAAAGAWGRSGWTHVELSKASAAELRPLLFEAWQLVAPKRLAASHAPAQPGPARASVPARQVRAARAAESRSKPARKPRTQGAATQPAASSQRTSPPRAAKRR